MAAAKAANAHGFIADLPDGYETQVEERASADDVADVAALMAGRTGSPLRSTPR